MARLEALAVAHAVLESFDVRVLPGQDFKATTGPVQFLKHGLQVEIAERGAKPPA